ncbi:MAG: TIGR01212 family radical SAM protein [Eubacteriales bacterium]|nr:TIGR01212 family radical SAM protein [Eubacteriales bacterium]
MNIRRISEELKKEYGTKVYKLSLSSGCTCPNRDGTLGTGGCIFCSEGGSGDFAAPFLPIDEQIRLARAKVDPKIPASIPMEDRRYIAYFQSFTNTYGDIDRLRKLYMETIAHEEIVILSIGTRPDCIDADMLDLLEELNRSKPVWIELGLQTVQEDTARFIRRGYKLSAFEHTYQELKKRGIQVIVHLILGLPYETEEEMLESVHYAAGLQPPLDGIKLQLLHVLKGTDLAEVYSKAPFPLFDLDSYCSFVVKCLQILPEEIVIHRLTGDGPRSLLLAPLWSTDKKRVLNTLNKRIALAKREE